MNDGLIAGLIAFACLPVIFFVMAKMLPFLLGFLTSLTPEPKVERKLKPYPDPIPEVLYGEVVEDYDGRYNCGQLYDGIQNDNRIFEAFWKAVRENGGRAPEHWTVE